MKRLNSTDIARLAGVSRSTVSRVINNYPNVPDETRERVMSVIREHHYVPQLSGQLLGGRKTRTLGLFWVSRYSIAPDPLSSSYFMHIVDAASAQGYMVLSSTVGSLADQQTADFVRRVFLEGRIDAGVFVGVSHHEPLLKELLGLGMVIGVFDCDALGPGCVTANFERDSGAKAVDYLYSLGHRKIGAVHGDMTRLSSLDRRESFLQSMTAHGLPLRSEWLTCGGITRSSGYEAAKRMLADCSGDRPTAIFANNDSVAFGIYDACRELGLRIPEDISVVGVDGHLNARYVTPGLTTVTFDFRSMFASLVDRVIDSVENGVCQEPCVFFPGELILRSSCRRL